MYLKRNISHAFGKICFYSANDSFGAGLTTQTFHILRVAKIYILILSSFDTCHHKN